MEIGAGSRVISSTVRGPASIAEGCVMEGTYIGPYTSVGRPCKIVGSSLDYCIVMDGIHIEGVDRLEESMIGRNAMVVHSPGNRGSLKLNISDHSGVFP